MTRKLLETTAFRLSLIYALLFSLVAAIALGSAYWLAEKLVRQQIDERLQLETNVLLSQNYSGNFSDLGRLISRRNNNGTTQFFVYALSNRQQHDFISDIPADEAPKDLTTPVFATLSLSVITHAPTADNKAFNTRVLITPLASGYQLLVGTDMSEAEQLLAHIASVLLVAVAVIVLAALLGGWRMGKSVLNRIDSIHRTAREIIEGDLTRRMPLKGRQDEFNQLAKVVNEMLDRLQTVMMSMQGVSDNLAHDLRNPLNRLHHRLEALRHTMIAPDNHQAEQELNYAIADVDSLIATFNAILNITRIESSVKHDRWEDVDIADMVRDMGEVYTVVAEEKAIAFHVYSEHDLYLHGDKQLIAQALANLLDNAIKYTPENGKIWLKAYRQAGGKIRIKVCDTGIGIPSADYERVFERFTRLDSVRNTPGNGLGLSMVKAIMNLHKGEIQLSDNDPGLCVMLIFDSD